LFARFVHRCAAWILLVSVLSAGVAAYYTYRLYRNLHTDFEELLPDTARSAKDLHLVTGRLASTENLAILVFSNDPAGSKRFVTDLSTRIDSELKDQVARVEYRIDHEIQFFKDREALYLSVPDLLRIRRYVTDRLSFETELYNPLNIFRKEELPEPTLNLRMMEGRYSAQIVSYSRFKDGFYATPDQRIRAILVYFKGKASGIGDAQRLLRRVRELVAQLRPQSYASDLEVKYAGDVAGMVEENAALISDLKFSTTVVICLVTLALLIFYRNLQATSALLVSLIVGTLWTFGVAYFMVGYLNANSAFLGSIVLGNGINFGIVILARYLEEWRAGSRVPLASEAAISKTFTATLTAALAAGLSYGSLILTNFRGFAQFGLIGFVGMALCWISAFTTLPATLVFLDRIRFPQVDFAGKRPHGRFSGGVAQVISHAPRTIVAVSWLLLGLAAVSAVKYIKSGDQIIETDTTKLRDRRSAISGAIYLSKYLDLIFARYLSPMIVLPQEGWQADRIAHDLKDEVRRHAPPDLISNVYSIHDFIPHDQDKKIAILRDIRHELRPAIVAHLSPHDRELVDRLMNPASFKPFGIGDLPGLVLDRFRENDGSTGKAVLVEPVVNEVALKNGDNQTNLVNQIRKAADRVAPGAPVVGTLPITADMYQSVRHEGPKATGTAFLAVVVLMILLFRNVRVISVALFALCLGVGWFGGIILHWDLKINFLNFIALPITFGIGVDYGINIFQRYRIEGRGSILHVVRGTGGAVALASLTTVIGYGSLLMAGNQAFFSFGRLAIIGEFTFLTAALVSLPAFLYYRDLKFKKKALPAAEELPERRAA
jgi:predicted RND superfamily exporter protein